MVEYKDCPLETARYERLAAYEATGLTPEEATAIRHTLDEYHKVADPLLRAQADGRLVVLPCKAGTPVWRITWTFATYPDESKRYVRNDTFFLSDLLAFGKTVFLTREEAEKTLQEMEGKG